MDSLDKSILCCLDSNARQSTSDIARSVRHGRDIVEYRMAKLAERGIIIRTRAVIDPAAIGKTVFKTYFRLQQRCKEIDAFTGYLRKHHSVTCYAETMGAWDLIVNVVADNPHDFAMTLKSIMQRWQKLVREVRFSVITDYHAFSRVVGKKDFTRRTFRTCGASRMRSADTTDDMLLSLLSEDGRMSLAELGRRSGAHVSTVKGRIEALEASGTIAGYRTSIDRRLLGVQVFKILVEETALDSKRVERMRALASQTPQILSFIEQLGVYPIEMNLEAEDYDACDDVMNVLFEKFEDIMKQSSVLLVRTEAFNTFPGGKADAFPAGAEL